jgi:hypothetical protein
MDFLDPQKQRKQRYIFGIGYTLIAVAILIATVILLYLSYGFNFGKNGQIIQNGLVFLSTPNTANIYINGELNKRTTNTRMQMPAGDYSIRLTRSGYRDWQRSITVAGASVQHFDYPFLFPKQLTTSTVETYATAPALAMQTPDQRWVLIEETAGSVTMNEYDLNNPKQTSQAIAIPSSVITKSDPGAVDSFTQVEWSTDNRHVLLSHTFSGGQEYIMFDRSTPANSVNVTTQLKLVPGQVVSLRNKAFDHYFVLDPATQTLATADFGNTTLTPYLAKVLAFKSYGSDTVLYATSKDVPADKAQIVLHQNDANYNIRQVDAQPPYLLDLTKYSGTLYTALGASGDGEVSIYQDPVGQQQRSPAHTMVPVNVLRLTTPNYIAFSANAQFIVAENGTQFSVYDAESDLKYTYTIPTPLDPGQSHAIWMDGDRLTLTSGGKLVVFDYDHTNTQTLVASDGRYSPFFSHDYKMFYGLAPGSSKTPGGMSLTSTSLLAKQDQ